MKDLTAAIIGAGRLGGALAKGLQKADIKVKYIGDISSESAEKLAAEIGAGISAPPFKEAPSASLIFLTVPDGELASLSKMLSEADTVWQGKHVFHCSGALASDILSALKMKGAIIASFHPLQTFPQNAGPERFTSVYFAIEGEEYDLGANIAARLGGIPFRLTAESKTLYHAAACMASNYLVALAGASREMLGAAGLPSEVDWRILIPLMLGTIESLSEYGIEEGLTGPVVRGDTAIVKQHLEQLKAIPESGRLYRELGKYLLKLAKLQEDKRLEMREAFEDC